MTDWDKMSKMYEKMKKEKPGFNKVTPIEQPTPEGMDGEINPTVAVGEEEEVHTPTQEELDEQFEKKLEEERQIMMERLAKKKGKKGKKVPIGPPPSPSEAKPTVHVNKLEKRIEYLEEAVQLLMKQQMEMLRG